MPSTTIAEFANTVHPDEKAHNGNIVDPDETAQNESSHLDLQCLPFVSDFSA